MRDATKSRDNLLKVDKLEPKLDSRLESPTSPVHDPRKQSVPKYLFLEPRFRPRRDLNMAHYMLITFDNETFTVVNLGEASTAADVKKTIAAQFKVDASKMALHLTDFGCNHGDDLNDLTLNEVLAMGGDTLIKVFIKLRGRPDQPGGLSPFDEAGKYPNTPSHMINDNNPDYFSGPTQKPPTETKPDTLSVPTLGSTPDTLSVPRLISTPKLVVSSPDKSDDSFKVIRSERKEINFDNRRPSPYENKVTAAVVRKASQLERKGSNLVAHRTAPPPPNRAPSLKRPPKTVSINTVDIPPSSSLKTYSPGQSENLIPQPYLGRQNAVSRKPVVSPVVEGESRSRSETPVPLFKIPEFTASSPTKDEAPLACPNDAIHDEPTVSGSTKRRSAEFRENDISFEGAPAFEDDESDSDDDGLWAKKPVNAKKKPELRVETNSSLTGSIVSPSTPYDSLSSPAGSPIRIRDEDGGGESWAVRPPAEVVYDNLERFFPNTDLDKPIIDEVMLSPIPASATSPGPGPSLSPVMEPKTGTDEAPAHIFPPKQRNEQPPKTQMTRMKTIRRVAREASEAQKRFSRQASASNGRKGGGLLRRKSTKMWGKPVVEMTPSEINQAGNRSVLRDRGQKGEFKQFVWVKGELIGKGTFGKVYLALNVTTGEMLAVKQVEVPQTASDRASVRQREVIDALHSEVETLKDLDHLNIVQYLGFEALSDVYNLFLEYVPGGSVGRILRMYGRFEEPIIKSLTRQVLDGLSYLHSCGILHRVSLR
jgi:mitogen-activated protein kinase kinase kinase